MATTITRANYGQHSNHVSWSHMPANVQKIHAEIEAHSIGEFEDGIIDPFLKMVNLQISKNPTLYKSSGKPSASATKSGSTKKRARSKKLLERTRDRKKTEAKKPAPASASKAKKEARKANPPKPKVAKAPKPKAPKVAKLPEIPAGTPVTLLRNDVAFVKRFVAMHGKQKTRSQVLSLAHSLQKGILEGRLRKGDTNNEAITKMQNSLLKALEQMPAEGKVKFEIADSSLDYYKAIANGEHQRKTVMLLKSYIGLTGAPNVKTKAANLLKKISSWLQVLPKSDPFYKALTDAHKELEGFVGNTDRKMLAVDNWQLSGIGNAAVGGDGLGRITNARQGRVAAKLAEANVKNFTAPELRRAFKDTKAPALCMEVTRKMVKSGDLSLAILRNPAAPDKSQSKKKAA